MSKYTREEYPNIYKLIDYINSDPNRVKAFRMIEKATEADKEKITEHKSEVR